MIVTAFVLACIAFAADVLIVAGVVVGKRKLEAAFKNPFAGMFPDGITITDKFNITTETAPEPPSGAPGDGPGFIPVPTEGNKHPEGI